MNKEILEKYETPLLLYEKETLIKKLKKDASTSDLRIILLLIFSIILTILIGYILNRNIIYKKRFEKLIKESENEIINNTQSSIIKLSSKISTSNLSQKTIADILIKLEEFEKSKKFISKKCTLHSLSKELKTNSSYLSKVINVSKGTNFANYLNNLRIGFAINKLKKDPSFRLFTIKAIAEEVGFNSTQSFSNAFYKKT